MISESVICYRVICIVRVLDVQPRCGGVLISDYPIFVQSPNVKYVV